MFKVFNSDGSIRTLMKMILVDFTGHALDTTRFPSEKSVEFKPCFREVKYGRTVTRRLVINIKVKGEINRVIDQGDAVRLFFSKLLGGRWLSCDADAEWKRLW